MLNKGILWALRATLFLSASTYAADKQKPFVAPTSLLGKIGPGPTEELLSSVDARDRARGAERLCSHGPEGVSEIADRLTSTRTKEGTSDALFLLAAAECLAASPDSADRVRGLSEILQRPERRPPVTLAPGQESATPTVPTGPPILHAEAFVRFAQDIAASALARSRSQKANAEFLSLLLSPTTRSRALLQFAPSLRQLPKLEAEARPEVALFLSEQINDLRWIPTLRKVADQEDPGTHSSAIRMLAHYRDLGSEKRFRRALELESSRMEGASALLHLGDSRSEALGRETLLQVLASTNQGERERALRSNLPSHPAFAKALLAIATSDAALPTRRLAVEQMAHQLPPGSFAEIHNQLGDPGLQATWMFSASRAPFEGSPADHEEWFAATFNTQKGPLRRNAARAFLLWTARTKRDLPRALTKLRSLHWDTKAINDAGSGGDPSFLSSLGLSPNATPTATPSDALSLRDTLLERSLDHGSARILALTLFAKGAEERDLAKLEALLQEADVLARVSLLHGLAENAKSLATRLLSSQLRQEPHPTLRGLLIRALLRRPASRDLALTWCAIEPAESIRVGSCADGATNPSYAPMLFRRPPDASVAAFYLSPLGEVHELMFDDDGFAIHFGTPDGDLILGPSVR